MDGSGLLWPAGPAPTESVDTYAGRRAAPFLHSPCRPTLWRRDPGPVVARIDVTSDHDIIIECIADDTGGARECGVPAVDEPRRPDTAATPHGHFATPTHSDACPYVDIDEHESERDTVPATASVFGPRLGVELKHDALEDDDDAEARLVRRRDRRAQTDRVVARAFRRQKRQRQRAEAPDMHQEPVPSAPSAALFDWDAFRISLVDASLLVTPSYTVGPVAPMAVDPTLSTTTTPFDLSAAFANIMLCHDPPHQALFMPLAASPSDASTVPAAAAPPDTNACASAPAYPIEARDAVVNNKPWAAPGDLVLIDREPHGQRTVVTVLDFDGAWYRVIVPRRDQSTPAEMLALSLTGFCAPSDACPSARWTNGQLDECAVCMDAEADAWFDCRCRVPAVCTDCARSIDTCPYCYARLERPPARVERDLAIVSADAPWIDVPLRIVLDGVDAGRRAWEVRAQTAWPGALLKAAIGRMIGRDMNKSRLLVGGRPLADQATLGAQGVSNGRLVCVIPRLRGD